MITLLIILGVAALAGAAKTKAGGGTSAPSPDLSLFDRPTFSSARQDPVASTSLSDYPSNVAETFHLYSQILKTKQQQSSAPAPAYNPYGYSGGGGSGGGASGSGGAGGAGGGASGGGRFTF